MKRVSALALLVVSSFCWACQETVTPCDPYAEHCMVGNSHVIHFVDAGAASEPDRGAAHDPDRGAAHELNKEVAPEPDGSASSEADLGVPLQPDQGPAADGIAARDAGGATVKTGTIVPLYTYPTDSSWDQLAQVKLAHPAVPIVAIVNPNSGPGSAKNADYEGGIGKLVAAGVKVIGYTNTAYGSRAAETVKAEIDDYKVWYPQLDGIFFDQQDNQAGNEGYYSDLSRYAAGKGLTLTVGNPGTGTDASYVGTMDVMLIYDSAGLPSIGSLQGWTLEADKSNFGIVPYGVSALDTGFVAQAKGVVGYIYVTNDELPNPWDSLPPYFAELVAELDN